MHAERSPMARRGSGGCVASRLAALGTAEVSERVGGGRAAEAGGADCRRGAAGRLGRGGHMHMLGTHPRCLVLEQATPHMTCRLMSRRMLRWASCHVPWAIMSPAIMIPQCNPSPWALPVGRATSVLRMGRRRTDRVAGGARTGCAWDWRCDDRVAAAVSEDHCGGF